MNDQLVSSMKLFSLITFLALLSNLLWGQQGQSVKSLTLIDPNDNPAEIPYIGEKVLMIVYTDPDVKDVNDPLSNSIKAKKFDTSVYSAIGIANCEETWIPNAAIRMKAKQKAEQFEGSVILLDEDKIVEKAWQLGDCNEKGVVIIIGKDKKIKYIKKVETEEESKKITPEVIRIIEQEIKK